MSARGFSRIAAIACMTCVCVYAASSDANATGAALLKKNPSSEWLNDDFTLTPQSLELLRAIEEAADYGLDPKNYFPQGAATLPERLRTQQSATVEERSAVVATFATQMRDAYISLAKDLYSGHTDFAKPAPSAASAQQRFTWDIPPKNDLAFEHYLASHLTRNDIYASLHALHPDYAEYFRLAESLRFYRTWQLGGGWKPIPPGPTIRIGMSDPRIPLLKQRLFAVKDLMTLENADRTLYDERALIEAVKSFQRRHNLYADGTIGASTLRALNVPVQTRIEQILLNLERFRHLPAGLERGEGYIDINIPAYTLSVYEAGYRLFEMKTVVGRKERPSPVLLSRLSYAVANPTWTVPKTILATDMLKAGKIASHVERYQMRVYAHTKNGLSEVNPDAIDWERYTDGDRLPFTFKADSGETNPLGKLKFIFPNRYAVYLHDTNAPQLFDKPNRSQSSGCVRISEARRLIRYLTQRSEEDEDPTLNADSDTPLALKKRPPLLMRYMTVGVSEEGKTYFYDDTYGYDAIQQTFEPRNRIKSAPSNGPIAP